MGKCKVITFTRAKNSILYPYIINETILPRYQSCRDLGVTFDSRLSFSNHIDNIVKSAWRVLGFVLRLGKRFENIDTLRSLYCTLVHPKLEYASLVWSPLLAGKIESLERVHRKFLKNLTWKRTGCYPPRGISNLRLCVDYNFLTLEERRKCATLAFLMNLFNHRVNCPKLLSLFEIRVPVSNSRDHCPLYAQMASSNFAQAAPVYRMTRAMNQFCELNRNFDIFNHPSGISAANSASAVAGSRPAM